MRKSREIMCVLLVWTVLSPVGIVKIQTQPLSGSQKDELKVMLFRDAV